MCLHAVTEILMQYSLLNASHEYTLMLSHITQKKGTIKFNFTKSTKIPVTYTFLFLIIIQSHTNPAFWGYQNISNPFLIFLLVNLNFFFSSAFEGKRVVELSNRNTCF